MLYSAEQELAALFLAKVRAGSLQVTGVLNHLFQGDVQHTIHSCAWINHLVHCSDGCAHAQTTCAAWLLPSVDAEHVRCMFYALV